MPHNCKVKKFTVIEHNVYRDAVISANFASCSGGSTGSFSYNAGNYVTPFFGKHDHHQKGFISGSYVKTGDTTELASPFEDSGLPSGGDFVYQLNLQFFFPHKHTHPPYNAKDTLLVQGQQIYDNNVDGGNTSVPTRFSIIGGTGKYRKASGHVKFEDLGCELLPGNPNESVFKYKYKFKVYLPEC